ncbi:UNVERIFIED_CONTAM: hypothetical protein GTU68_026264 [Idotea baltica]|nr:hypothetical protein [Idotea baltica]
MAGITDAPFRDLCAREGAAYAASEMISSDALLFATNKTRHRIKRSENDLPHCVQIAGSDPQAMADVAALNVKYGAEVIDINMGCPAKKVCNKAAGSALLEFPELVRDILKSVIARVDVPVTLKIRTGPNPEHRNGVQIALLAEQEGVACLAVHGRTRADRFKGEAEYKTITEIKKAVSIPVIANGDIKTAEDAKRVLALTNADGVMIGRAAQGNPWLFKSITEQLAGRSAPLPPTPEEIHETLIMHLNGLYSLYGEYTGVRVARKHIAWYCKGIRNAAEFRSRAYTMESSAEQLAIIEEFFTCPDSFALHRDTIQSKDALQPCEHE